MCYRGDDDDKVAGQGAKLFSSHARNLVLLETSLHQLASYLALLKIIIIIIYYIYI